MNNSSNINNNFNKYVNVPIKNISSKITNDTLNNNTSNYGYESRRNFYFRCASWN